MSTTKKISNITNKQISEKGIQALANRPNASAQYGVSGLSPTQLKLWFDKLATFLAEKINEIQNSLSSDEAAFYIRIILDEQGIENIGDLVESFSNGVFAEKILQILPNVTSDTRVSLQKYINDTAESFSRLQESIEEIALDKSNKLDKITIGDPNYVQLYAVDTKGNQIMKKASLFGSLGEGTVKLSASNGQLNAPNQITYKPTDDQFVSKRWVDKSYGDLPERVTDLEKALINFAQDDTSVVRKPVPLTSSHIAYLNSIDGKAVLGKNKFDPREFGHASTIDSDGTISFYRESEYDEPYSMWLTLPAGTWTIKVYNSTENAPNGEPYTPFGLYFSNTYQGETITNNSSTVILDKPTRVQLDYGMFLGKYWCKFKVMLSDDPELPYEPYGYVPTVVTEVKSYSANLIPFPYKTAYATYDVGAVYTHYGLTFTVLPDRSIKIYGAPTSDAYMAIANDIYLGDNNIGGGGATAQATNGQYSISSRLYWGANNYIISVSCPRGTGMSYDDVVYPMANKGGQLLPYVPYFEPISFKIPDGILALPDYGLSMPDGSFANTVDFDNKVYYHRCTKDKGSVRVLSSEEVIPISEYLKDSKYFRIEVQGGGELEFISDIGEAVSSKVTFLLAP